jgi:hypothetical protein
MLPIRLRVSLILSRVWEKQVLGVRDQGLEGLVCEHASHIEIWGRASAMLKRVLFVCSSVSWLLMLALETLVLNLVIFLPALPINALDVAVTAGRADSEASMVRLLRGLAGMDFCFVARRGSK